MNNVMKMALMSVVLCGSVTLAASTTQTVEVTQQPNPLLKKLANLVPTKAQSVFLASLAAFASMDGLVTCGGEGWAKTGGLLTKKAQIFAWFKDMSDEDVLKPYVSSLAGSILPGNACMLTDPDLKKYQMIMGGVLLIAYVAGIVSLFQLCRGDANDASVKKTTTVKPATTKA